MNKVLKTLHWLLLLIMVVSIVWAMAASYQIWQQAKINDFIADPEAYEQVPDNPQAHFAKARSLVKADENELALEQLTLVLGFGEHALLPDAYYNRGNINLRKALAMSASDARHIPLVELAKADYRTALKIKPEMWDARYNLEVALRVVPEDPALDGSFDKEPISSQRSIESKAFKIDLP